MRLSAANTPSPDFSVQSEVPRGCAARDKPLVPSSPGEGEGDGQRTCIPGPFPHKNRARGGEGRAPTPGSYRVSRGGGEGRGGNHTGERRAPSGNQPPRCSEIPCRSRGRAALPGGAWERHTVTDGAAPVQYPRVGWESQPRGSPKQYLLKCLFYCIIFRRY